MDFKLNLVGGRSSTSLQLSAFLIIALICSLQAQNNCANSSQDFNGCTACDITTNYNSLILNLTSNLKTCTNISGCIAVDNETCVLCNTTTTLTLNSSTFNSSTQNGKCVKLIPGCKVAKTSNSCRECYETNYQLVGDTCVFYVIDYCWKKNASGCLECSDQNIHRQSNCSISSANCKLFNYEIWQCQSCPTSALTLHSSGLFCYQQIPNCLVYQLNNCIQCNQSYYLNNTLCNEGFNTGLFVQVLSVQPSVNGSSPLVAACLNINLEFNTTTFTCQANTNKCLNGSFWNCSKCVPNYYLDLNKTCKPCSQFPNCLFCDKYNCKQCLSSHYLAVDLGFYTITDFYNTSSNISAQVKAQCLPCSIYGCLVCHNQFNKNNISIIHCDQCLFGYKLYNYTCFQCQDGTYFNITTKACQNCSIDNCQFCNNKSDQCDQCIQGFYWDGTNCTDITEFYNNVTQRFSFEILNKSLPKTTTQIINDQILLIQSCSNRSNGYVCLCPNNTNQTYSSLCYPINSNLTATNYTLTTPTKTHFINKLQLLQLLSELPNFTMDYLPTSTDLLSLTQFAAYLQIKTNYIRNHYQLAGKHALAISNFVFSSQSNVFSPFTPTILSGPGYYFKYTPSTTLSDDSSFLTVNQSSNPQSSNTAQHSVVFVLFNNTISSIKAITGYVYIFLGNLNVSSNVTLKIKKIGFLQSYQSYLVQANSINTSLTASSDSQGFLTISNVMSSTNSSQWAYFVTASIGSPAGDIYFSSRIENLIYRDSFIYILVIFTMYFILVPLCFLVDFVDKKAFKRKIPKEDEAASYQGIKHKTESEQPESAEDDRIQKIYINYKDFFPIYNIANTAKPKRILKLCLFIVNIQHSITFLSLIYFHLPGGQALVAVLLAIPAYLCTIIMGYLCGLITLKLPDNTKYLINLLTLVYWVIWVVVMSDFVSSDYKPYVYTFVVIFFLLDMLFDFLETLLMYFTIKQETRQIKLFRALSKWLSFRGYYEFDEMAKDLAEARDNE